MGDQVLGSLKPPLGPSQYVSTAVSGHVSLWTYDALVDFLAFYQLFFKVSREAGWWRGRDCRANGVVKRIFRGCRGLRIWCLRVLRF